METRKELKTRIAELDVIIAGENNVNEENSRLYREAETKLETELKQHLINADFPVNEFTRIVLSYNHSAASVYFKNGKNTEFTVTFSDRNVHEVNATGISSRGNRDDLDDMESYYKMVSQILEKLNPKKCETYHGFINSFFDTLENYKSPDFNCYSIGYSEMSKIRKEKNDLETQLKVLDLDLGVGKKVEVYIEGTGRRFRGHYIEMTVEKITEKTITLESKSYGKKVIKTEDVLGKIRNVKTEGETA